MSAQNRGSHLLLNIKQIWLGRRAHLFRLEPLLLANSPAKKPGTEVCDPQVDLRGSKSHRLSPSVLLISKGFIAFKGQTRRDMEDPQSPNDFCICRNSGRWSLSSVLHAPPQASIAWDEDDFRWGHDMGKKPPSPGAAVPNRPSISPKTVVHLDGSETAMSVVTWALSGAQQFDSVRPLL